MCVRVFPSVNCLFSLCLSSFSFHTGALLQEDYTTPQIWLYILAGTMCTAQCLWASVHVCITVCPSWSREQKGWKTWQKIYTFSRGKGNNDGLQVIHGRSWRSVRALLPLGLGPPSSGQTQSWAHELHWSSFSSFYAPFNVTIISHSQAVASISERVLTWFEPSLESQSYLRQIQKERGLLPFLNLLLLA